MSAQCRCLGCPSKRKLALAALNNILATELSLKNSLANRDQWKKPVHERCLSEKRVRQRKWESWQSNRKANTEGKSLISEKEAAGTVNKRTYYENVKDQ